MTKERIHLLTKQDVRQTARHIREGLDITALSRDITLQLKGWSVFVHAKTLLAYAALPGEITILSLLSDFPMKQWYFPRVISTEEMVFHRVSRREDFKPGSFGILEPQSMLSRLTPEQTVDLVLLPALAMDTHGNRLGFGKGYYDRYLNTLTQQPYLLCPLPQALLFEQIPTDPWDIPIHGAMTEVGLVTFSG